MPTPTSAARIIDTSLPPSPIAHVLLPVYRRIALTTSAFWVGEQRQQTTAGDLHAVAMKNCSCSPLRKVVRTVPSTMRTCWSAARAKLSRASTLEASVEWPCAARTKKLCIGPLSLAEIAMQMAVSTLSPVSIHTRTLACLSLSRVTPTSIWSLSSTPVRARRERPPSRDSIALLILPALSVMEARASEYLASKSASSLAERTLEAITRVRSPVLPKLSHSSFSQEAPRVLILSIITASAPFM
mmetsp:Transcript_28976/g.56704  ORF Transcript_28976/g.56704 Transcript_28976/m.56704 type:complete len:243 (-) Transcript_28976:308-1036(-)